MTELVPRRPSFLIFQEVKSLHDGVEVHRKTARKTCECISTSRGPDGTLSRGAGTLSRRQGQERV